MTFYCHAEFVVVERSPDKSEFRSGLPKLNIRGGEPHHPVPLLRNQRGGIGISSSLCERRGGGGEVITSFIPSHISFSPDKDDNKIAAESRYIVEGSCSKRTVLK